MKEWPENKLKQHAQSYSRPNAMTWWCHNDDDGKSIDGVDG